MDMKVYFPGNLRVNADYKGFTVETDQPATAGGDGSAPAPFDLFVASLGTCAGITLTTEADPQNHLIRRIIVELNLPDGFPPKYEAAVVRAVEQCTVKRHLANPPAFSVTTSRTLPA